MAGELDNALDECVRLLKQVSGIRFSYEDMPSRVNATEDPFLMAISPSGTWEKESSEMVKGLHNIQVGVYVTRKEGELARAIKKVLPFGEKVKDKLLADGNFNWADANGNATIDAITGSISYTFGPLDYADEQLFGWTFTIPIKIKSNESSGVFSIATS